MNKNPALIVFLKFPEKGNVKTRLAADFGDEFAVQFYKLCLEKLINDIKLNLVGIIDIFLFCSNDDEIPLLKEWLGEGFRYKVQSGTDLGKRMVNAFDEIFKYGYNQSILTGTDIPDLNTKLILESFQLLNNYDVILGPSDDGGYYLIGMKQLYPEIFQNVNWSSDKVFSETINRVETEKLTYYPMEALIDIDNKEGLKKWLAHQNNKPDIQLVKLITERLPGE